MQFDLVAGGSGYVFSGTAGSVAGFFLVVTAFALLTSTFGLLIAALGNTPEATRGIAILATLMLVMLGGAWVPTFVFPEWLQSVTMFVPTRSVSSWDVAWSLPLTPMRRSSSSVMTWPSSATKFARN